MKHIVGKHGVTVAATVVIAAALTAGAPVVARTVVDYARNADRVDGRHAVGPNKSQTARASKLVATDRTGRLPNNIIRKAPRAKDADRLRGFGPNAFLFRCQGGSILGQAHVTPAVGASFERVTGFGTTYGGPVDLDGNHCRTTDATARRVTVGTYDVRLALVAWACEQSLNPDVLSALVSVQSADPLLATYEPVCENNSVHARVRITDLNGAPQDAPFTVALLGHRGYPIP